VTRVVIQISRRARFYARLRNRLDVKTLVKWQTRLRSSPQQTSSTIYYSTVFITETTAVPKLDNEISAVYSYLAILKLIIGPMGFRVRNGCMAHFVPNVEKSSGDYLQTSEKLAAYLWEMMTLWE